MYMLGRLRTASRPSSTVMDAVLYSAGVDVFGAGVRSFSMNAKSPCGLSVMRGICLRNVGPIPLCFHGLRRLISRAPKGLEEGCSQRYFSVPDSQRYGLT